MSGLLLQTWSKLCGGALAVLRLLVIAAALCLTSLISQPSAAYAARAPACATASVSSPAVTAHASIPRAMPLLNDASGRNGPNDGRSAVSDTAPASTPAPSASSGAHAASGRWAHETRACVPLADLAAGTTTGAGSGPASPSALGPSRNLIRGTSRGADTLQDPATSPPGLAARNAAVAPPFVGYAGPDGSAGDSGGGPAVAGGCSGGGGGGSRALLEADQETVTLAQQLGVSVAEAGVVRLFERNRASVVNISGMRAMQTFTTLDLAKMPYGQGSGFLWGEKGHVVTCYHLVKGAAEVKVTLSDNTSYTAKLLGYDAAKDLAVLKLSVPKSKLRELQPVTPGSAAALRVGQTVFSIGNPWGLGHTLSKGVVCGLGLELSAGLFPVKGVILSDTAPDAGSGGGVLLDSKGNLIGMVVTPPAGNACGGSGRSFAVPIDAVRGLINQILAYGRTMRPALGITMAPAQVLDAVGQDGVLVLEVPPGSPAHAAGLRHTHRDIFGDLVLGDIIIGLDGKVVRSSSDVYDILDEHRVGDRVRLDILRDGKQTSLTVTLGERLLGAVEE